MYIIYKEYIINNNNVLCNNVKGSIIYKNIKSLCITSETNIVL